MLPGFCVGSRSSATLPRRNSQVSAVRVPQQSVLSQNTYSLGYSLDLTQWARCAGQRENLVVAAKMLVGGYRRMGRTQSSSSPTTEVISDSPSEGLETSECESSPSAAKLVSCCPERAFQTLVQKYLRKQRKWSSSARLVLMSCECRRTPRLEVRLL